jgi:hypothetical protein
LLPAYTNTAAFHSSDAPESRRARRLRAGAPTAGISASAFLETARNLPDLPFQLVAQPDLTFIRPIFCCLWRLFAVPNDRD